MLREKKLNTLMHLILFISYLTEKSFYANRFLPKEHKNLFRNLREAKGCAMYFK